ncbi:hypothetical protein E2C01_016609 [Portunus trituberculatus]|uniref:Uncharacterized protein n=1 Tax=Portunus trituberculatus TaxID=210409 RepID=A0A5B7DR85_PORTR|nr:hypothetical protein [Portunus trituberculatus]
MLKRESSSDRFRRRTEKAPTDRPDNIPQGRRYGKPGEPRGCCVCGIYISDKDLRVVCVELQVLSKLAMILCRERC